MTGEDEQLGHMGDARDFAHKKSLRTAEGPYIDPGLLYRPVGCGPNGGYYAEMVQDGAEGQWVHVSVLRDVLRHRK